MHISLSLSRWNHVAGRLRVLAQKTQEDALASLGDTRISSPIDEEQKQAMLLKGQKSLADVASILAAHRGIGLIRAALAVHNAQAGVAEKLALMEALRGEKNALLPLKGIPLLTMPSVENANEALEKHKEPTDMYRRSDAPRGVALRTVPINALHDVEARLRQIDTDVQVLSDEVNDLNKEILGIDLPEEVVKLANL